MNHAVYEIVANLGGSVSAEHGLGPVEARRGAPLQSSRRYGVDAAGFVALGRWLGAEHIGQRYEIQLEFFGNGRVGQPALMNVEPIR